jgi:NTE family protein
LKNIERIGGTSAGAITALCISLGYHANELEKINEETPYQKFNYGKNVYRR